MSKLLALLVVIFVLGFDAHLILQQIQPQPTPQQFEPVAVEQSTGSLIWLALINVFSLAALAIITRYADARKEHQATTAALVATAQAAKIKADEREADWKRQDEVARQVKAAATQAAEAAGLLVKTQIEVVRRQDEVAKSLAESDAHVLSQLKAIDEQGKVIHTLVNSDMTQVLSEQRDQTKLTLLALKRGQALSVKLGIEVSPTELATILETEARIIKLEAVVADRIYKQRKIDREAIEAKAKTTAAPTSLGEKAAIIALEHIDEQTKTIAEVAARTEEKLDLSTAKTAQDIAETAENTAETAKNTAP